MTSTRYTFINLCYVLLLYVKIYAIISLLSCLYMVATYLMLLVLIVAMYLSVFGYCCCSS